MNNLQENPDIMCIQKCTYCNTITHQCNNEDCSEPARAVCQNQLCQAKLLIEYYQAQVLELKEINRDELLTLKEKTAKQAKIIDTYRLLMMTPANMENLVNNG